MTERPILFSAPMVLAILGGQKTQTRRVAKPRHRVSLLATEENAEGVAVPMWTDSYILDPGNRDWLLRDAAMRPGDALWVREAWGCPSADRPGVEGGRRPQEGDRIVYAAEPSDAAQWVTGHPGCADFCWRPSIHMPRWASRIDLRCTDVRVERLTTCSEADAVAEGIYQTRPADKDGGRHFGVDGLPVDEKTATKGYRALWEHINGPASWEANPLVFVYTFEQVPA